MINVYLKKRKKEDEPWEGILASVLKRDYQMETCPEILREENGKPYLKNHPVYFNVSHSGEYLAIAVSDSPVGIDIQKEKTIREGMYQKVVQQKEQMLIGTERQKDFLRLWALKESFVKADGRGLRISMKDYYFTEENGRYFVNYIGQKVPWTFTIEETLIAGYVIAVCGAKTDVFWKVEQR